MARSRTETTGLASQPPWRRVLRIGAILLGTGLAVWVILASGIAASFRKKAPEQVVHIFPFTDAGALAMVASGVLMSAPDNIAARQRAREMANQALRADATIIPAITTLAFIDDIAGDKARARRLFKYTDRLSKRDLRARLWLIEDAVSHNDLGAAIAHYDIALRTSPLAADILFPVMTAALDDFRLVEPFAAVLARRPRWGERFLPLAFGQVRSTDNLIALVAGMTRAGAPLSAERNRELVDRLLKDHRYTSARQIHGIYTVGVINGAFEKPIGSSPFDWQLANELNLNASREPRPDAPTNHALWVKADSESSGELARQLTVLPEGNYIFSFRAAASTGSGLDWRISCKDNGNLLAKFNLPASAQKQHHMGRFLVKGCEAQILSLNFASGSKTGDVKGWVDDISISPIRKR